jgi:5-methyltetrahydrofolate--homocysteine methyltransferase
MVPVLQGVFDAVVDGKRADVEAGVKAALDAKLDPSVILNTGLIEAMREVGRRFETGDCYVPEMLIAARAMQAGLAILKPQLAASGAKAAAKVVVGTVKGDQHDIGKNLVGMMLEGAGYEIVDLGTDVSPQNFAAAVREHCPLVVGMSALLTTTMQNMTSTIEAIEDVGMRAKVKIIVGGAPLTEAFAKAIGADGYAPDASRAVTLVRQLTAADA